MSPVPLPWSRQGGTAAGGIAATVASLGVCTVGCLAGAVRQDVG